MIFSHFKRGKGIRFDDGFRHSARDGAAPDPDAPPIEVFANYDALLLEGFEANDPVPTFTDFAGGHDGTQETLAAQMTYDPDGPGGLPALICDGGQFYVLPDELQIPPTQPITIYAVATSTTSAFRALVGWSNSGNQIAYLLDNRVGWRVGVTDGGSGETSWSASRRLMVTADNDTTSHRLFVNRELEVDQSTGSSTPSTEIEPMIGARNDGENGAEFMWSGSIQQILVAKETHNAEQRATMWAWLEERWNL